MFVLQQHSPRGISSICGALAKILVATAAKTTAAIATRNLSCTIQETRPNKPPSQTSMVPSQFRPTTSKNYYQLLGISRYSSAQDIKTAYYILAKQYHPDSRLSDYPATKQKFEEINEAYNILCDETQRSKYDDKMFGKKVDRPFSKFAGNGAMHQNDHKAVELVVLPISFMNSVNGARREVHVTITVPCKTCKSPKSKYQGHVVNTKCAVCGGSGLTTYASGDHRMQMKCSHCRGSRFTMTQDSHCADCEGKGTIQMQRSVPVTVRAGCADNEIIRIPHPIDADGWLDVKVKIEQNGHFRRAENDVYSDLVVPFTVAILGGRQEVRDIYGGLNSIQIPPGTPSDTTICLAGKGVKSSQTVGNHIVQVKINIPSRLTTRQRTLLKSFYVG